jgi:phosphoribosylformylglycinamidine cyclo-ligase
VSKRYDQLGVSASKNEVHKAIKDLDKGLYANAFCKVLPDIVSQDPEYCNIMHADTAGTKTSLAYLQWKETKSLDVWSHIAQDALVMNLDDLACIGAVDQIVISSTIGRNKHLIPFEIISELISANQRFIEKMSAFGIQISNGGGETADVGDIVRTIDVGITAFCRMPRKDVIVNQIAAGQVIIGFASFGKAVYEEYYNSGIGSNGLTAARHDILEKNYLNRFPETCSPETSVDAVYTGSLKMTDDYILNGVKYRVGDLLTSGTRTYLPVIKKIISEQRKAIHGIIHCSGGGQTKVKKFAHQVRIIKDSLFELPPVFEMILQESKYEKQEMYEIFNMGHRLEIYADPEKADAIINISKEFGVDAKIIGRVEEARDTEIFISSPLGEFSY